MEKYIIERAEELCTIINTEVDFKGLAYLENAVVLFVAHGAVPCHEAIDDYLSDNLVADYLKKENINFFYFDGSFKELKDLADEMGVDQVPTIAVYTYGLEIGRFIGRLSGAELVDFVRKMYDTVISFDKVPLQQGSEQ